MLLHLTSGCLSIQPKSDNSIATPRHHTSVRPFAAPSVLSQGSLRSAFNVLASNTLGDKWPLRVGYYQLFLSLCYDSNSLLADFTSDDWQQQ